MGRDTSIQWCDDTVNPTSGCDGCELYQPPPAALPKEKLKEWLRKWPCYAAHTHEHRLAHSFPVNYAPSFGEVRMIPGRLQKCAAWPDLTGKDRPDKPWLNGMPRLIFISDMADALSKAVSFEYLYRELIVPVIAWQRSRHIGLWLTKQPARMADFAVWLKIEKNVDWPANLWAGTSATTQATYDMRMPHLLDVPAQVRFISAEPLRAELNMGLARMKFEEQRGNPCIQWVIVGGESGSERHRMDVEWLRGILDEGGCAHIPIFVKQLGRGPFTWDNEPGVRTFKWQNMDVPPRWEYHWHLDDSHGGNWSEWPEDLRVRQMPSSNAKLLK